MADNKRAKDAEAASVSSSKLQRSISVRLSTVITVILVLALLVISFFGGMFYQRSNDGKPLGSISTQQTRHFSLGLVVYSSSNSITIDNEHSGAHQTYTINTNTLVSINGTKATASQIKAGDIVLIRYTKHNQAAVILVNSSFSD